MIREKKGAILILSGPSEILIGELSKYLAKVNDSDDLALKMNQLVENTIEPSSFLNENLVQ